MSVSPSQELIEVHAPSGKVYDSVKYSELSDSDWGYVYERHVAQIFNEQGYTTHSRSHLGYRDNGMDIIVENSEITAHIQCKYLTKGKLSMNKVEWILYKASRYLEGIYDGKKLNFWLVVTSIPEAFSSKKSKNGSKSYPAAEYFLSKNQLQNKVRLEIHEIPMQR